VNQTALGAVAGLGAVTAAGRRQARLEAAAEVVAEE
jgi:hypothetical protein